MSVLGIGISYGLATLFAMFSGMPIAFALGAVAVVFMAIFMPTASLDPHGALSMPQVSPRSSSVERQRSELMNELPADIALYQLVV